jgi:hypothetical protein
LTCVGRYGSRDRFRVWRIGQLRHVAQLIVEDIGSVGDPISCATTCRRQRATALASASKPIGAALGQVEPAVRLCEWQVRQLPQLFDLR